MNGKKNGSGITVQYEGPAGALVRRHETEYFPAGSRVEVKAGQEAVIVPDRGAPRLLTAGVHELGSGKAGDVLHCRVYYVNQSASMKLLWGTNAPLKLVDARFGVSVDVRANGSYSVKAADSLKLVSRLSDALEYNDPGDLQDALNAAIASVISGGITDAIKREKIDCREIAAHRKTIGGAVGKDVEKPLEAYGLRLDSFSVDEAIEGGLGDIEKVIRGNVVKDIEATGDANASKTRARARADEILTIGSAETQRDLQRAAAEAESQRMKAVTADYVGSASVPQSYPGVMPGNQGGYDAYPATAPAAEELDPISARMEELQKLLNAGKITCAEYEAECEKLV